MVEILWIERLVLNVVRSTLLYDGECIFCACWVEKFKRITKGQVEYLPFQSPCDRFPQILIDDCERSIHWVDLKGNVFKGAEAIFRILACVPGRTWPQWMYENVPGFALVTEYCYQMVSRNRKLLRFVC